MTRIVAVSDAAARLVSCVVGTLAESRHQMQQAVPHRSVITAKLVRLALHGIHYRL